MFSSHLRVFPAARCSVSGKGNTAKSQPEQPKNIGGKNMQLGKRKSDNAVVSSLLTTMGGVQCTSAVESTS